MKGKNLANNAAKLKGNASKATLPNGEKLSDKIQQNKVNQGVNGANKQKGGNSNNGEAANKKDSKNGKEQEKKEGQGKSGIGLPDVKGMGAEAAREALKKAAGVIPYTKWIPKGIRDKIIDKFMDSDAGQEAVEKGFKTVRVALMMAVVGAACSVLMWLFMMSASLTLFLAPVAWIGDLLGGIADFFSSLGNWLVGNGWCASEQECQALNEEEYYTKLNEAIEKYQGNCAINEDLITATIFYNQMVSEEKVETEDEGFEQSGSYFNYLDVNDTIGAPKAHNQINKLINVYWKGEELKVVDGEEEALNPDVCINSAVAYRNYLINTYIPNYYNSIVDPTKGRSKEEIADEILTIGGISIKGGVSACRNSCTYDVNGKSYSEIKIQLTDNSGNNLTGTEPIFFEDYIVGVVYGEMGVDASSEAWKAHAIAVRNKILSSSSSSGDIKLVETEEGKATIYIKNSSSNIIYCSLENGCSERNDGVIVLNPNDSNSNPNAAFKPKYGLDSDSELRQQLSQVIGMTMVDSSNVVFNASYDNTIIETWITKANEGKTYTEILGETYSNMSTLSKGTCSALCNFAAGPYTEWKQYSPEWGSIPLGTSTIEDIGCLYTSVCIQVARSGVYTPLGENFNPGTLMQNYSKILYPGGNNWVWKNITKIVPNFVYTSSSNKTGLLNFSDDAVASVIAQQLSEGCYPIVEVKTHLGGKNQHWVAVDTVVGNEIYIMDPGNSKCKKISDCPKYKISRSNCYKVKE